MQWFRFAFAFMLILSCVAALKVTPSNVSGQGYVTFTTQTTTTGLYTYAATTQYVTSTETSNVYRGTFAFSALPTCWWEVNFNATHGQRFHIEWTGQYPVGVPATLDFYISTPSIPINPNKCAETPFLSGQPLYSDMGTTGPVDWLAPSTGRYIAWLGHKFPGIYSGILSIATPTVTKVASISYAAVPTTELLAFTTVLSAPVPQVGLPFGNLGLLVAGAAVAVIAGVLVVARRRKSSVETALIQEPPATVQEAPKGAVAPQPVIQSRPSPPPPVIPTKPAPPQPVIMKIPPIVSTGYVDLDRALDGGIPENFSVVIVSPSFDERDLLLRKIVESALSSGKLAIFVSNDIGRTKDMTSRYVNGFYALSPQADKIPSSCLNLLKIPSIENLSEATISLGITLRDVMGKEKATKPIMILDILSDLLLRYRSITTRRWLTDFVGKRKAEGFTIIATLNPLTTTKEETQSIIDFFDGVIEIFEKPIAERTRRFLMIKKMYGQRYSENEMLMDKDKLF